MSKSINAYKHSTGASEQIRVFVNRVIFLKLLCFADMHVYKIAVLIAIVTVVPAKSDSDVIFCLQL